MNFIKRDIIDVLGGYLDLTKSESGQYYSALCPFHDDHDPSLKVYPNGDPEESVWRCMSCSDKWGDVIDFVQKIEGCSFTEAVRLCTDGVSVADVFLRELGKTATDTKETLALFAKRGYSLHVRFGIEKANSILRLMDEMLETGNVSGADKLLRRVGV